MAKCSGITRDGERCRGIAIDDSAYCYAHDPDRAEERRRNAHKGGKRGGRGRPSVELTSIKERLSTLAGDVLEGSVDRSNAAVAGQLLNTMIRAIGMEMREMVEAGKERRRYGA